MHTYNLYSTVATLFYTMNLVELNYLMVFYLVVFIESLVQLPLCGNAARPNQAQNAILRNLIAWMQTGWGTMLKKRFNTWWLMSISFTVFHTPSLAATTHAATNKAWFIAEHNKHAGVLLKIAPKNISPMAIHTWLGKVNLVSSLMTYDVDHDRNRGSQPWIYVYHVQVKRFVMLT